MSVLFRQTIEEMCVNETHKLPNLSMNNRHYRWQPVIESTDEEIIAVQETHYECILDTGPVRLLRVAPHNTMTNPSESISFLMKEDQHKFIVSPIMENGLQAAISNQHEFRLIDLFKALVRFQNEESDLVVAKDFIEYYKQVHNVSNVDEERVKYYDAQSNIAQGKLTTLINNSPYALSVFYITIDPIAMLELIDQDVNRILSTDSNTCNLPLAFYEEHLRPAFNEVRKWLVDPQDSDARNYVKMKPDVDKDRAFELDILKYVRQIIDHFITLKTIVMTSVTGISVKVGTAPGHTLILKKSQITLPSRQVPGCVMNLVNNLFQYKHGHIFRTTSVNGIKTLPHIKINKRAPRLEDYHNHSIKMHTPGMRRSYTRLTEGYNSIVTPEDVYAPCEQAPNDGKIRTIYTTHLNEIPENPLDTVINYVRETYSAKDIEKMISLHIKCWLTEQHDFAVHKKKFLLSPREMYKIRLLLNLVFGK